jgi:hypothetical protein
MPRRKCPAEAHKHGDIWHYPGRKKQWRAVTYMNGKQTWRSFPEEDECQKWYDAERAHRSNTGRPTPSTQFAGDKVGDIVRAELQRLERKAEKHSDVQEYVSDRYYLQRFLNKEEAICAMKVTDLNRRVVKEFIAAVWKLPSAVHQANLGRHSLRSYLL